MENSNGGRDARRDIGDHIGIGPGEGQIAGDRDLAVWTRSLLSFTAASGNPTISELGLSALASQHSTQH